MSAIYPIKGGSGSGPTPFPIPVPIPEALAAINNNQVAPTDVTGMTVDSSLYRGATVWYQVTRETATNELVGQGYLSLVWKPGALVWDISVGPEGPDAHGVDFTITTTGTVGQVQYTSSNMAGAGYTGQIEFFAWGFNA